MDKLWQRMAEIYGHRWTSSYGEKPNDTWVTVLADLPITLIANGLKACVIRIDAWPPTLPEFRSLCLGLGDLKNIETQAVDGGGGVLGAIIRRRIGSWDMGHGTYRELAYKAKSVLEESIQELETTVIADEVGRLEDKQKQIGSAT